MYRSIVKRFPSCAGVLQNEYVSIAKSSMIIDSVSRLVGSQWVGGYVVGGRLAGR